VLIFGRLAGLVIVGDGAAKRHYDLAPSLAKTGRGLAADERPAAAGTSPEMDGE